MSDNAREAAARALCKSGKFETGQGGCALVCMSVLGESRRNCPHVCRVHGALVDAVLAAVTAPADVAKVVLLLASRDGQEFDGEIHLTTEEGLNIVTLLQSLSARLHAVEGERDSLKGRHAEASDALGAARALIAELDAEVGDREARILALGESIAAAQRKLEALSLARLRSEGGE